MNERIKELIERATRRGEEYLPGNDGHPTPTFYFDKEKFAELIIEECLEVVEKQFGGGNGDGVEWDRAIDFTYNDMKQHFGVE